jgi:hypothetical protein
MPAQPRPHSTPAALMKPRGPRRSISQPSSGCTQVWQRMKSVKANWMSESFQPVAPCIGWTKSVQAYCRFAIMIIASSEAPNWNQRLLMLTALPPPFAARAAWRARRQGIARKHTWPRVAGIDTPKRLPTSMTAPTTASSSIGRPAS